MGYLLKWICTPNRRARRFSSAASRVSTKTHWIENVPPNGILAKPDSPSHTVSALGSIRVDENLYTRSIVPIDLHRPSFEADELFTSGFPARVGDTLAEMPKRRRAELYGAKSAAASPSASPPTTSRRTPAPSEPPTRGSRGRPTSSSSTSRTLLGASANSTFSHSRR